MVIISLDVYKYVHIAYTYVVIRIHNTVGYHNKDPISLYNHFWKRNFYGFGRNIIRNEYLLQ